MLFGLLLKALQRVQVYQKVLKELNRISKKGGRFYLSVMTDKWDNHLLGGKIIRKKAAKNVDTVFPLWYYKFCMVKYMT